MNVVESILYILAVVVLMKTILHGADATNTYNLLVLLVLMPSVFFIGAIVLKLIGVFGILHQIKRMSIE
jgi:hypothetical protein